MQKAPKISERKESVSVCCLYKVRGPRSSVHAAREAPLFYYRFIFISRCPTYGRNIIEVNFIMVLSLYSTGLEVKYLHFNIHN